MNKRQFLKYTNQRIDDQNERFGRLRYPKIKKETLQKWINEGELMPQTNKGRPLFFHYDSNTVLRLLANEPLAKTLRDRDKATKRRPPGQRVKELPYFTVVYKTLLASRKEKGAILKEKRILAKNLGVPKWKLVSECDRHNHCLLINVYESRVTLLYSDLYLEFYNLNLPSALDTKAIQRILNFIDAYGTNFIPWGESNTGCYFEHFLQHHREYKPIVGKFLRNQPFEDKEIKMINKWLTFINPIFEPARNLKSKITEGKRRIEMVDLSLLNRIEFENTISLCYLQLRDALMERQTIYECKWCRRLAEANPHVRTIKKYCTAYCREQAKYARKKKRQVNPQITSQ